jgi:hypothetical protein
MPPEDFGPFWNDAAVSAVRRPPPLQSILRLQRTVGNQAAQRILGIGDGCPVEVPATDAPLEPAAAPRRNWRHRIAALAWGRRLSWTTGLAAGGVLPRGLLHRALETVIPRRTRRQGKVSE